METHASDQQLNSFLQSDTHLSADWDTHLSGCSECQQRLLELAGGADWRNQYSDCLDAELLSETLANPSTLGSQPPTVSRYEARALEAMLEDILQPANHPELLGRLGRYDIEEILGSGGMGVVFRAFDTQLHRPVAIKMILPFLSNLGTAKQRFTREARAVAAILHPNVVAIHGVEQTNGIPWFVMPLIAGPTLAELVRQDGPLPERDIVRIALQIASGLTAAHNQGLIHRDIKPENILVDNRVNRVLITDFGLARWETEPSLTREGNLAGTIHYMSPEQMRGEDLDPRSDLYSLGSLLYFLASGKAPFDGHNVIGTIHEIANTPPRDVRVLNPEISSHLWNLIARLLEKDPTKRFQSASQLVEHCESYVAHLNHPTRHQRPTLPAITSGASVPHQSIWKFGIAALLCCSLAWVAWGSFGHLFTPVEPIGNTNAKELGKQLQNNFGILPAEVFANQVSDTANDVRRLGEQLRSEGLLDSDQLESEIDSLQREIAELQRELQ